MTHNHFRKIKSCLEAINKIQLQVDDNQTFTSENKVKVDYKHTIIDLDDYSLIISGSAEQHYKQHHSTEKIFLFISLYDSENNEMFLNKKQHTQVRELVKIKTAV